MTWRELIKEYLTYRIDESEIQGFRTNTRDDEGFLDRKPNPGDYFLLWTEEAVYFPMDSNDDLGVQVNHVPRNPFKTSHKITL